MKIAVCFSGQLRAWRSCVDSWTNLLNGNLGDEVDIFCQLWDYNSIPTPYLSNYSKDENVKLNENEISDLLELLKPKKIIIQEAMSFGVHEDWIIPFGPLLNQLYAIKKVAELKKEYEIENNFLYDLVVRTRYDLSYSGNIANSYRLIKPNTITAGNVTVHEDSQKWQVFMSDILWHGDSITFDVFSDLFNKLASISKNDFDAKFSSIEFILAFYANQNQIMLQQDWEGLSAKIIRDLNLNESK